MTIDLNADLGEGFGRYTVGNDAEIMKYISSANIACGFHAGDPSVMEKAVSLAIENGVVIGAHPGFPDLQGFGRRVIQMSSDEITYAVIYQVGALKAIAESMGARLNHVKAHGALYNKGAGDSETAEAIAKAISLVDKDLIMFGLPGSCLEQAAKKFGLQFAAEAFADRAYKNDGTLVPRSEPGAMIKDEKECIKRVQKMISEGIVSSLDGLNVRLRPDTICLHGDNPDAVLFASRLVSYLKTSGIRIKPLSKRVNK